MKNTNGMTKGFQPCLIFYTMTQAEPECYTYVKLDCIKIDPRTFEEETTNLGNLTTIGVLGGRGIFLSRKSPQFLPRSNP